MLHEKVWLANLQVLCPSRDEEINKIAGQLRNLFYAASLPWCNGNLGRVIPKPIFEAFHEEYLKLQDQFNELSAGAAQFGVTLTYIPFPVLVGTSGWEKEKEAKGIISTELQKRFERRIRMLRDSLIEEKRFYESLLSELKAVVDTGLYLEEELNKKLVKRIKGANSDILCYSAEAIRQSRSLREDIINICGALL